MTKENYELQEAYQKNVIDAIKGKQYVMLVEFFNNSTNDYEKQGVIEAAQLFGHGDLAVELMGVN
jgi:hypothetical protein